MSTDQPAPATERAYAWVKARILEGELEGGMLISEGDVAGELGMSRTPVREAFLRLQTEGWMRLYPKRGALVVPITPQEIAEVVEARTVIEAHAVRRVTEQADAAEALAALLTSIIARQQEAAERADVAAFASADADFHGAIVSAGGNSLLESFYTGLRDRQRRMTTHSVSGREERTASIITEHRELTRLITELDADGFAETLTPHMRRTHRELLAQP